MKCCGEEFNTNLIIKWPVCNGNNIKLPIETKKIDYYYQAHDDRDIYLLEGRVKRMRHYMKNMNLQKIIQEC